MISVLIESHNQERALAETLAALVPGAVEGLVSEVIVFDHGSEDGTRRLVDAAGARLGDPADFASTLGSARGQWLLLLEPGARPQPGWIEHVSQHIGRGLEAARFRQARTYRSSILKRFRQRRSPLAYGLLLRKSEAAKNKAPISRLRDVARSVRTVRLECTLIPAEHSSRA